MCNAAAVIEFKCYSFVFVLRGYSELVLDLCCIQAFWKLRSKMLTLSSLHNIKKMNSNMIKTSIRWVSALQEMRDVFQPHQLREVKYKKKTVHMTWYVQGNFSVSLQQLCRHCWCVAMDLFLWLTQIWQVWLTSHFACLNGCLPVGLILPVWSHSYKCVWSYLFGCAFATWWIAPKC